MQVHRINYTFFDLPSEKIATVALLLLDSTFRFHAKLVHSKLFRAFSNDDIDTATIGASFGSLLVTIKGIPILNARNEGPIEELRSA
jgi:hypothetical protein